MIPEFRKATRENVSLLIALAGASGSGKTMSALRLADGIAGDGKIAMIDTEARRGLHYADQFDFLHCDMPAPFSPDAFAKVIASVPSEVSVVIIDSFSHEYDGAGGIIDHADRLAAGIPKHGIAEPRSKRDGPEWWQDWEVKPMDSPGNWKEPKMMHRRLMRDVLQSRNTLIFCLRADEKIEIVREGGRTQVRPLGWSPICEKRFMYEMTASFTLDPANPGKPSFSRPHKLQEQHRQFFSEGQFIGEEAGKQIAAWANGGESQGVAAKIPVPTTEVAADPTKAPDMTAVLERGHAFAEEGYQAFSEFWKSLSAADRKAIGVAQFESWKRLSKDIALA